MALLELSDISKHFKMGEATLRVLADINLTIYEGEFIALVGPSGAGKSTLMHIMGGLDAPSGGEVFFDGAEIYKMKESELNKYRGKHIGFVFQQNYLLDDFTALENVMMPALIAGVSTAEAQSKAKALLENVGLGDRLTHFPKELSGGEQQRAAVARALVNSPKLLLADEPTGNLDKLNSDAVIDILGKLTESGVSVVVVTHDESVAARCKRIIRLEKI